MKHLFRNESNDISHTRPHMVTGNHARHASPIIPTRDLFDWTKQDRVLSLRKGWHAKSFRVAIRTADYAVQSNYDIKEAIAWLHTLQKLVLQTRWILPWPSKSAPFKTTSQDQKKNKFRRILWVSTIYSPERIQTICAVVKPR
ncbi:hypothetical protein K456DRAFT_35651 [Colletotrichum gloeosporioides 23]|nr:hypothetical protein K456DRAFT_35651 [Colletotrichum gloeosporioides 23]